MRREGIKKVTVSVGFIWTDNIYDAGAGKIAYYRDHEGKNRIDGPGELDRFRNEGLERDVREVAVEQAREIVPTLLPTVEPPELKKAFEPPSGTIDIYFYDSCSPILHSFPAVIDRVVPPLVKAAAEGNTPVAIELVARGYDVNGRDESGRTPLIIAASIPAGVRPLELLLGLGADLNTKDNRGRTPLMIAASNGDLDKIQFLVGRGANSSVRDSDGSTVLIIAASARRANATLMKSLIALGSPLDAQNRFGQTALMLAASLANQETVEALVRAGADVKVRDALGRTALSYASVPQAGIRPSKAVMALLQRAGAEK